MIGRRSGQRYPGLTAIAVAGIASALGATPPDEALQTVVVTATKMGETPLQSTPLAIDAYTSQDLQARAIDNLAGLISYSPSVQLSDLSGYSQLFIRGIGSNTVFIGSDPSSTVHLDGVYLARPLSLLSDFLDVERVEVLKGPQGTLYGRNSVGGTVNIISRRPTPELTGEFQGSVGNYDQYGLRAYIAGPLGQTGVLGSLAVNRLSHSPYLTNVSTGGGVEKQDDYGLRGQLLFPIGEGGSFTLRADYARANDAMGGFPKLLAPTGVPLDDSVLPDPHRIATNLPSVSVLENYGTAGELDYKLGDQVSLKSLTAWRGLHGRLDLDADSSSNNLLRTLVSPIQQDQLSEELDLTARWTNLTGVAGVYYFHEHDAEPLTLNVPAFGVSNIVRGHLTNQSVALFGQAELALTSRWSVIAGLRYSHESKDYDVSNKWTFSAASDPAVAEAAPTVGAPFFPDPFVVTTSRSASALTPKAGLNFRPTDDILLYLSATRGFKSGGFDYGAPDAADAARGYAPEYIWSYETGMKSEWLDHRLRVNLDAFHYNYTNLQVEVFVPPANAVTENAASARVNGLEAEIRVQPSRQLALYADVAWLDATYSDYPGAYVKAFETFDATGKRLNHAPTVSTTVGGTYRVSMGGWGSAFGGVDYHWQGQQFFTPANDGVNGAAGYLQQQGAYGILSARLGWSSQQGRWEITAIGSNLTDRFYVTSTADYTAAIAGRPGEPRTYRLQVTRIFAAR